MPATQEITRSTAMTGLGSEGKKLSPEDYRDAYIFGANSSRLHYGTFEDVEEKLRGIWDDLLGPTMLEWLEVKHIVRQAYSLVTQDLEIAS